MVPNVGGTPRGLEHQVVLPGSSTTPPAITTPPDDYETSYYADLESSPEPGSEPRNEAA
ncbi:hypothetical protein GCM10022287_02310 [Gryllotalpicola koreensis]|uniref:Uncharacterized protein n=1 Tax=Gryllotalpicola koreensis TaxID=993086 RepID=A0ABP7ZQF9_9MICO